MLDYDIIKVDKAVKTLVSYLTEDGKQYIIDNQDSIKTTYNKMVNEIAGKNQDEIMRKTKELCKKLISQKSMVNKYIHTTKITGLCKKTHTPSSIRSSPQFQHGGSGPIGETMAILFFLIFIFHILPHLLTDQQRHRIGQRVLAPDQIARTVFVEAVVDHLHPEHPDGQKSKKKKSRKRNKTKKNRKRNKTKKSRKRKKKKTGKKRRK